jgi:predicted dehydrogenase
VHRIAIVGTGFVADLYMNSLMTFPGVRVIKAYDTNRARLAEFSAYWNVPAATEIDEVLDPGPGSSQLILNLTNPCSHFEVSQACLQAGKHVYSEKPLATTFREAQMLCALAESKGLLIASAPCSVLGEAAQTLWLALRRHEIGKVRLIYAELDDNFVLQAPYRKWFSASGAPWPYRNEFITGCTLEHAGYYLTWLMAMFGTVEKVIAASATLIKDKLDDGTRTAPDFSCANLFFASGVVARLSCSIIAPHNHSLRIVGDEGILEVEECWNNDAAIRVRRRHVFRRRLVDSFIARRVKIKGPTHPKVERRGAAQMNFALGPAEMLAALQASRPSRLSAGFALHLTEVALAMQHANGVQIMETTCPSMEPMTWAVGQ